MDQHASLVCIDWLRRSGLRRILIFGTPWQVFPEANVRNDSGAWAGLDGTHGTRSHSLFLAFVSIGTLSSLSCMLQRNAFLGH